MLPIYHIFFSIIAAILIFLINPSFLFIILFLAGAILIDVDHYLLYIVRKKDFSLIRAYKYFRCEFKKIKIKKSERPKVLLSIFHTIEFYIILLVLSYFIVYFWPVLLGCLFHRLLDLIYSSCKRNKKYVKAFSIIWYLLKKIIKRKR